jgi:membrane protein insertase Oxa1/YidC/SpoIIIJ
MGCIRVGVLQAAIKEGRKMTQKDAEYETQKLGKSEKVQPIQGDGPTD